ncbi:MAG: DsrE family protein [Nitrososphaeria archaeon]
MADRERLLYVVMSGPETPEKLYAPFILATAAKKMDIDATIFFMIKGILIMRKGVAEVIKMGNMPPLAEFIKQAQEEGVEFMICEQSTQILGLSRGEYIEGCKFGGPITLNDLMLSSKSALVF